MINKIINNKITFNFDSSFSVIIGLEPSKGARSPILWNAAYEKFGLDINMHPLDVSEDSLEDLLIALKENSFFCGGAVAVPYKEKIINILKKFENSNISPEAIAIGAANSIYIDEKRNICATNTDGESALKSLIENCNNLEDKNILLLGVGGAGKAVSTYIANYLKNGKLNISARKNQNSIEFIKSINAKYIDWPIENFDYSSVDIIINCTTLGSNTKSFKKMSPLIDKNLNEAEIFQGLKKGCILFDIIYDPLETYFLKIGRKNNFKTLNGLQMNLDQAVIAFNYASKFEYELEDISRAMSNISR